ncbi:MAG: GNAT family N-acetyltransferase, partial [Bacteroidetes bacterium]|nr:GNAT family N-acetyltransferase [Bacteroidota bacterium]
PKANSADDARAFIDKINAGIPKGEWVYWAIIPKDKSKLIGTICLWKISEEYSKAEIGFELLPQFQGKGFMQEALTAVLDFGFNVMNLKSIEGEVDPNNDRSIKILEKNKFVKIINLGENIDQDGTVLNTVVYSLSNKS